MRRKIDKSACPTFATIFVTFAHANEPNEIRRTINGHANYQIG